jgi:putative endonuclease
LKDNLIRPEKMYTLYILKCNDNSLYTGITNNLEKRLKTHQSKKGSKYVRAHLPFKIVYQEQLETKSQALKREIQIKKMSREEKLKLYIDTEL